MCCVVLCVCVPKSNSRAAVAVVAAGRRKINCRSGSCHCHCRLQSYRGHCVAHSLRLSTPPNWPLNQVAFVFFAVPIDTAKCVLALGARVFVVLFVMFSCRNSRSSKKSPLIAPLLSLSTSTWIHFVLLYPFPSFSFCVMLKIYFSVLFWTIRSKKRRKNECLYWGHSTKEPLPAQLRQLHWAVDVDVSVVVSYSFLREKRQQHNDCISSIGQLGHNEPSDDSRKLSWHNGQPRRQISMSFLLFLLYIFLQTFGHTPHPTISISLCLSLACTFENAATEHFLQKQFYFYSSSV